MISSTSSLFLSSDPPFNTLFQLFFLCCFTRPRSFIISAHVSQQVITANVQPGTDGTGEQRRILNSWKIPLFRGTVDVLGGIGVLLSIGEMRADVSFRSTDWCYYFNSKVGMLHRGEISLTETCASILLDNNGVAGQEILTSTAFTRVEKVALRICNREFIDGSTKFNLLVRLPRMGKRSCNSLSLASRHCVTRYPSHQWLFVFSVFFKIIPLVMEDLPSEAVLQVLIPL